MLLHDNEIKNFLEEKYYLYNKPEFVLDDPVGIPHRYHNKEDIEIAGFLSATISWGQRKTIIKNAGRLMDGLGNNPYDFIMHANEKQIAFFDDFVHRTFNGSDCIFFLSSLQNIYRHHGGLERIFSLKEDMKDGIMNFRKAFLDYPHLQRSEKHLANPLKNSSAKRLNMFLRWMVRRDESKVDFGIWKSINPRNLYIPLDVHSGRVARKLGLLKRKADDWKAVEELTQKLRTFDPHDPVKYDFALFGMGMYENF